MKLVFNIMSATSFVITLFLLSVLVYSNITKQKRLDENRKFVEETIEEQVNRQIRGSMPQVTGPVYVPNK
tara:strand:+ start:356 stop:565 length:210 start_codon:yes stop_codon:yes gene_type:complete